MVKQIQFKAQSYGLTVGSVDGVPVCAIVIQYRSKLYAAMALNTRSSVRDEAMDSIVPGLYDKVKQDVIDKLTPILEQEPATSD